MEPTVLPNLEAARLRAERIRIISVLVLCALLLAIGVFRLVAPVDSGPRSLGVLLLAILAGYMAFEGFMLAVVSRAATTGLMPSRRLGVVHAAAECLYPIVTTLTVMIVHPGMRFTMLVSPLYGFMLVLIGISALRLDVLAAILVGVFTTIGYALLVIVAFAGNTTGVVNPHPAAMYVNTTVMLGVAGVVAVFMTRQIREYVFAAVREVETRRQRDRLVHDLEIASEIQRGLLPKARPHLGGYELAAASRPAEQTGGDYFDWQEPGPQRLIISLADVTGHGIGPALVTAACRAYIRATMTNTDSPSAVMQAVNRLLYDDISPERFVTLALLDINAASHEVRLLSAGHGPTLHVRSADETVTELDSQGLPLGVLDDQVLDEPFRLAMAPGDFIVLLSDGFFEQHNGAGEAFGTDRIRDVLLARRADSAQVILDAMEAAVHAFAGSVAQEDDRTAVIIKRLDSGVSR